MLHARNIGSATGYETYKSTPYTLNQSYLLTVTKSGTGTGTVTSSSAGIDCGATCSAPYSSGTPVTLTATASTGTTFAGWTGACTNSTGTCSITMDSAKSVTATFNTTTVVNQPDLIVSSFTPPASANTGTSISVPNAVMNQGGASAVASSLRFYLSTDNIATTSDTYLTLRSIGTLSAGESSAGTTTINIPVIAPGTYYICAIADATNTNPAESNETNNTLCSQIIVTSGIDLTVSAFTVQGTANTGTTISIDSTVLNSGTGTSVASNIRFYISTDNIITTSDTYLTLRSVGALSPSATSAGTSNINIPVIAPGTYFIGAIADATDTNPEISETNNTASSQITLTSGIDLTVSAFTVPISANTGTSISIDSTVLNNGAGTSVASNVRFYISTDNIITTSDTYLTQRSVGALSAGATNAGPSTINIPVVIAPGTYYIGAIADATNTNAEISETNNTASSIITLTSGVDLIVSAFNAPGTTTNGTSITVSNTVLNQGAGSSVSSYIRFYISDDNTITASDTYLGQRTVGILAPGASSADPATTVNIPATVLPGTYFIGAIADATNTNPETNETNNTISASISITSGVDLVVSAFASPAAASTGTGISVPNTVANNGAGTSASSTLQFYVSADATITTADTYIGQRTVPALSSGASSSSDTTLTIPATVTPGNYYIGAIADATNTNPESSEANNTMSASISITSGVDFVVSAFTPPAAASTGTSISVPNTVANNGAGTSASSYISCYLSDDAVIKTADTYIGQRSIAALTAGASNSASSSLNIPLIAPGIYYIGAIADATNTNPESNETNNTASALITLASGVDLTVSSFSAPNTALTGTTISVAHTVSNLGLGTSKSSYLNIYLSADAVIDTSDTLIGTRNLNVIIGGDSNSSATNVTIPVVAPGTYYIGAIADANNNNIESSETNNTTSSPISITSGVDLTVTLSAPSTALTGTTISVAHTVSNLGLGTSKSSYLNLYLSADSTIDATDTLIGTRNLNIINGGDSNSSATNVTIPVVAPGTYYIGAIADANNNNIESSETNNTTSSPISITSGVDLTVTLSAPSTALTGTTISVAHTVSNLGNGTSKSSQLNIYLSADSIIDASDTLLGTRSINIIIGSASISSATNVTIPSTTPTGTYYIGGIADANNNNIESNESNNTGSSAISITP